MSAAVRPFSAAAASSSSSNYEQAQRQLAAHAYPVVPKEDFGSYKEYSVIHTDRSLNLMSDPFQTVMNDLNVLLKTTYNADQAVIIPGYVLYVCMSCCLLLCMFVVLISLHNRERSCWSYSDASIWLGISRSLHLFGFLLHPFTIFLK